MAFPQHLLDVTLHLPAETLRFEGGDVVIVLSDDPADTMVLHSRVLGAASPRFKARFGGEWGKTRVKKVLHPETGAQVQIYGYKMIYIEDGFSLADMDDVEDGGLDRPRYVPHFHHSGLAEGFPNFAGGRHYPSSEVLKATILQHKLLFGLVYGRDICLQSDTAPDAIEQVASIVALAEYYELFPAIAEQVEDVIIDLQGSWKDVARFPLLYMALGKKLHSETLFVDALKHYVGGDGSLSKVVYDGVLTKGEASLAILPAKECLQGRIHKVIEDMRKSALTEYQAHANLIKRKRGPEVRTTWLAARSRVDDVSDKAAWLACSIFREWLDHQLVGEPHWSHIKYSTTQPKNGEVDAGSFRKACEVILQAAADNAKDDVEAHGHRKIDLELLGHKLADRYARIFELKKERKIHGIQPTHPAALIARVLRSLVIEAKRSILNNFYNRSSPEVEQDPCYHNQARCECGSYLEGHDGTMYNHDLRYYTCMTVEYDTLPWANLPEWPVFCLPQVNTEQAGEMWLRVVGVKAV